MYSHLGPPVRPPGIIIVDTPAALEAQEIKQTRNEED
jgi:hypothetical protein